MLKDNPALKHRYLADSSTMPERVVRKLRTLPAEAQPYGELAYKLHSFTISEFAEAVCREGLPEKNQKQLEMIAGLMADNRDSRANDVEEFTFYPPKDTVLITVLQEDGACSSVRLEDPFFFNLARQYGVGPEQLIRFLTRLMRMVSIRATVDDVPQEHNYYEAIKALGQDPPIGLLNGSEFD